MNNALELWSNSTFKGDQEMSLIKEAPQKLSDTLDDQENSNPNQSSEKTLSFQGSASLLKKHQGDSSQGQGLNRFSSEQSTSLTQNSSRSQRHQFQNSTCNMFAKREGLDRPFKQKRQTEQIWTGKTQSNSHGDEKNDFNFSKGNSEDESSGMIKIQAEHQVKGSACEEAIKRRQRVLNSSDFIQLKTENSYDVSNLLEIIGQGLFREKEESINQQEKEMKEQQNSYKNFEDLGQGSFGKVIRQLHVPTRKFYALKVLKAPNKKIKRRIAKREFKILQIIKQANSPILLQIENLKNFPNFFARMEYGDGTLDNFLNFCKRTNRMKCWKDDDILTLYSQLWSQLQVLKELNIFHSDIKPSNIIISSEGFFVISDFGISILLKKLGRQKITVQGTDGYYMPEIENVLDQKRKRKHKRKYQRLSCEYDPMEQDHFACIKIIRKIIHLRKKSDSWEKLLERAHTQNKNGAKLSERNCLRIYNDNKEDYHIDLFDQIYEAYDWNKKLEIIDNLIDHCHFDKIKPWVEEKLERIQKGKKSLQSQEYLYLCFLKGRFQAVQSKYQEALQDYTKCEEVLRKFEEGKIGSKFISRLYSEMSEAAVFNYDLELARAYIDKSFKIKLQNRSPTIELAQDYRNLACIEYFEGNREKAVENCHKGLKLFEPTNINTRFLDLKNILGISLEALGRYDQAYEIFQDLHKRLCQVYGETHSKVTIVLSNIAKIFDNTGRSKDALSYQFKSLKINHELFLTNKRNQLSAYTLIDMTVCYAYLGELEQALRCARESVQIVKDLKNNDPYVFVWMIAIAEICGALKEYEGANEYLQRYLDSYSQMPNSQEKIFLQKCFIIWDYCVHKRKGPDLAYKKFKNRLKYLAQNPQTHPVEAIVHQRFGIIEIMKGEYKAALHFLRKAHEILDQNQIEKYPSFFSVPGIDLHIFFKSKTNLEEASEKDLKAFCEEYYEKCSPFLIVAPKLYM